MTRAFARLAVLTALTSVACRLEPAVGELRRTCAVDSRYDRPPGFDGTGPDPRCQSSGPTVENECDRCENERCCASRFGCYDDTVCRCADQTFDECLDSAAEQDAAPFETLAAKCAADFEATGAAAKARLECRERACATECKASAR
jgi:hypothetical protein